MASPRVELAQLRTRAGYSQESLAEHLAVARNTVGRWEQGIGGLPYPRLRRALAGALGVSVADLEALFVDAADDVVRQPQSPETGSLWQLHEVLQPATASPKLLATLGDDIVLMDQTFGSWPHDQLWREIGLRLQTVTDHLSRPQQVAGRRQLVSLAGRLAGLRGCVLFDTMSHHGAATWFEAAKQASQEATDPELAVWVTAHQGLIAIDASDYATAQTTLEHAVEIARRNCSQTLVAWVEMLLARAHAELGDVKTFSALAERANARHDQTELADRRHGMDFDSGRLDLTYYGGLSYLALNQTDNARTSFASALDALPHERRRARAVLQLSVASVAAREGAIDQAISEIDLSLDLTGGAPAERIYRRAHDVRRQLGSAARDAALGELDSRLADIGRNLAALPSGDDL